MMHTLTAYTKNANTKRTNSGKVAYDFRHVTEQRLCRECGEWHDVDDMASTKIWPEAFLAAVQKHLCGNVCADCIDQYVTCENCSEVYNGTKCGEVGHNHLCPHCMKLPDPFDAQSERHGWEQV